MVNTSYTFYSDDAIYATLARRFSEGDLLHAFHPFWTPLFPFLISLFHSFTPEWETAGRLVSVLSASLLILPLYFLAKKITSSVCAIIFSTAVNFALPIFEFSLVGLSDSLSALLIVSSITAMFFWINNCGRSMLLLGAFLTGLSYLTRPDGLLFFFLFLFFISFYILFQIFRKKFNSRKVFLIPLFVIVFLITVSPYVLATRIQTGVWTLTTKSSAQFKQNHAFALRESGETWAQEVWSVNPNYSSDYFIGGAAYLSKKIDYFLLLFGQKLVGWKSLFLTLSPIWSVAVFSFAMFVGLLHKQKMGFLFLLFVIAVSVPVAIFSAPFADIRYLLWVLPFFVLFFVYGIRKLILFLGVSDNFASIVACLTALTFPVFSWNLVTNPKNFVSYMNNRYFNPDILEVAQIVSSERVSPVVMARHEGFAWYANGQTVYLPQGELENIIDYARRKNVDYLVASESEISGEKELGKLFDSKEIEGLNKKYEMTATKVTTTKVKTAKGRYIIYGIKK